MEEHTILLCKNIPIYNVDMDTTLNEKLLPGYMKVYSKDYERFSKWLKLRYSSNTNTLAHKLKGIVFGQGNRKRINRETQALSLIDCYWIKQESDPIKFEDISPYYRPFWDGTGDYAEQSATTLYVPGYLNKCWVDSQRLYKFGGESTLIEASCLHLCQKCGIPAAKAEILPDMSGIAVYNITSPQYMLEQADQSGLLDPDDFDTPDILRLFGDRGYEMILIDAIVGNGDRHAGNFGWIRSSDTGEYVSMSPLYDFDHAFDSTRESDILTSEAISLARKNKSYFNIALRVTRIVKSIDTHLLFKVRAGTILNGITK